MNTFKAMIVSGLITLVVAVILGVGFGAPLALALTITAVWSFIGCISTIVAIVIISKLRN